MEKLDEASQIGLFNAINEARQSGGKVLAAGNAPPAQLPLREDLKSRLAWGLVYQVKPLTDDERRVFLRGEAERRGMQLPDEVISYLLTRMRRDTAIAHGRSSTGWTARRWNRSARSRCPWCATR